MISTDYGFLQYLLVHFEGYYAREHSDRAKDICISISLNAALFSPSAPKSVSQSLVSICSTFFFWGGGGYFFKFSVGNLFPCFSLDRPPLSLTVNFLSKPPENLSYDHIHY